MSNTTKNLKKFLIIGNYKYYVFESHLQFRKKCSSNFPKNLEKTYKYN